MNRLPEPQREPPRIDGQGSGCRLFLPGEIISAIRNYDPAFIHWETSDYVKSCEGNTDYYHCTPHQLPYAVIGDFNNDSTPDIVLAGHSGKSALLLAVLSSGSAYAITEIQKQPLVLPQDSWIDDESNRGLWAYLLYYHPDTTVPATVRRLYPGDGFLVSVYGKGADIYRMVNGKFVSAVYSD